MRAPVTALLALALLAAGCATDTEVAVSDDSVAENTPVETERADTGTGDADTTDAGTGDADSAGTGTGDADSADAGGAATGEEDPGTDDAPPGARATDEPGDVEIDIRMFDFEDDVVEIGVGETVTWSNRDATRHTVTSGLDGEPDGAFEVTFDERGDMASVTFDEPGDYTYFCTPHNFMTGTVIVTG